MTRFAAQGVTHEAMAASYAMAENVFAVTQSVIGATPATMSVDRKSLARGAIVEAEDGRLLVSSGRVVDGVELGVRIAFGEFADEERTLGEFVIGGQCVIDGYFGNPEATAAAIRDGHYPLGTLVLSPTARFTWSAAPTT